MKKIDDVRATQKKITVYPGKIEDYAAYGRVGMKDAQGHTLCKESLSKIKAAFSPRLNKAGEPTALLKTTYEVANNGGKVEAAKFRGELDSLKFMVWDPYIDAYSLQMNGTACGKKMSFNFDIRVDHSAVSFQALHSQFPNPEIDYSLQQNLAGDVAQNSFTHLPGTSVSFVVTQSPSYSTEYGFLQIVVGSSFVQGDSAAEETLVREAIMVLGESETPAIACKKLVSQGDAVSEDISTIFQTVTVEAGKIQEIAFTSSPHVFTAPYFSTTSCDGHNLIRASQYDSSVQFITYLLQRPVVKTDETSHWVPLKKVDWSAQFSASCPHDFCGLGLGTEKTPFVNAWQVKNVDIMQPKLNADWVLKPTLPVWTTTVPNATSSSLFEVTDGREGEFHTNYYAFCPKMGESQSISYDYLGWGQDFDFAQNQTLSEGYENIDH